MIFFFHEGTREFSTSHTYVIQHQFYWIDEVYEIGQDAATDAQQKQYYAFCNTGMITPLSFSFFLRLFYFFRVFFMCVS